MALNPVTYKPDYVGEHSWMRTFPLWYLGGDKPASDESVDVYVDQAMKDSHFAQLVFVQGCTTYNLMNLDPTGLRNLAKFLIETAEVLEELHYE